MWQNQNFSKCFVQQKNWVVDRCCKSSSTCNSHRLYKNWVFVSKRLETKMSKRDIFKNVLDAFVQHDGEWKKLVWSFALTDPPLCLDANVGFRFWFKKIYLRMSLAYIMWAFGRCLLPKPWNKSCLMTHKQWTFSIHCFEFNTFDKCFEFVITLEPD
jgi:hypothetical protein